MASPTTEMKLERTIGLPGGVALVIGGVIGMGIYALIAAVAAQAGSALWLAFLIAIIVSIIGVLPIAKIASALPRDGAGYLYTSRLLNPYLGSLTSYFAILGGASSTAMVALGVAQYITPYLPVPVPELAVAIALPILFFFLYIFGLRPGGFTAGHPRASPGHCADRLCDRRYHTIGDRTVVFAAAGGRGADHGGDPLLQCLYGLPGHRRNGRGDA